MLKIIKLDRTDSTNSEAWRLLSSGEAPPFVVASAEQTAGRGRFGRKWHSPKGGLWFSIVVNTLQPSEILSLAAAYSVVHVVKELTDICPRIRIPNDIVIGGRKLAGILIERDEETVVVGIGLNLKVEHFPEDLREEAISLHKVTSSELKPDEFLKKISTTFLDVIKTGNFSIAMWLCCLGEKVEFWVDDKRLEGKFFGIIENTEAVFELKGKEVSISLSRLKNFRKVK